MARFSGAVTGLAQAKKAILSIDEVTRANLTDAVRKTAIAMVSDAQSRVPVRTGTLRKFIGWSGATKKNPFAKVGVRSGYVNIGTRQRGKGRGNAIIHAPRKIAHLVEFGHGGPHPAAPHPFMIPAAEAQREPFLQRCRVAGKRIERDLTNRGGIL
jgi:HK97 gp10 family phage protein